MPPYPAAMLFTFALTLFASATLLFLVEPMVGKLILPLLGGTPAVWNTCMVFFQGLLLAGYGYAHATTARLGARRQALLHLAVLAAPLPLLAAYPLVVRPELVADGGNNPIPGLLLLLTASVGLPFFVVSASAPLLQRWFASTAHPAARDPYFLYGASNFGSMLALLGYPIVVEPHLTLATQRTAWCFGYALLAALTAGCAAFLWRAVPAPGSPGPAADGQGVPHTKPAESRAATPRHRHGHAARSKKVPFRDPAPAAAPPLSDAVAWNRRLRWVALSAVPSSLMLGVTTYMTTDIAAIPLLWVLPLALYLLSFIVVFARIPPLAQALIVLAGLGLVLAAFSRLAVGVLGGGPALYAAAAVGCLALLAYAGLALLRLRDPGLLHKSFLVAAPLTVLLLLFLMLSDLIKGGIGYAVAAHLVTLFVVAMACHGELARDRPAPGRLTEYFLWMSAGGVLGGLFNALAAPLLFNGLYEYPLALVAVCFLLPPAGRGAESPWALKADAALAALFLAVGGALLLVRWNADGLPGPGALGLAGNAGWLRAALLGGVTLGAVRVVRASGRRAALYLDVALPLLLGLLVVGLYWGLASQAVWPRLTGLLERLPVRLKFLKADQLWVVLTFGVPAVLCYTFIERPFRFGLSVGALVLAVSFCAAADDHWTVYKERSFFGVLRVDTGTDAPADDVAEPYRRLMHGTTMHGKQYLAEGRRGEPLTYYHRTGPVGSLFAAYNTDPRRPFGVVGLGTGTMASYGRPGQHVTFYDIDPVVRRISYDSDEYFTFVRDARARGVDVSLVMGDARLTMQREEPAADDKYGVLVVDAFSSDAIPVHLITWEALEMFLGHVRPDGIVFFHISNRYLDLEPVLANFAERGGLTAYVMEDSVTREEEQKTGKAASTWVAVARRPEDLARLESTPRGEAMAAAGLVAGRLSVPWRRARTDPEVGVWTDDYSNLWSVFDPKK